MGNVLETLIVIHFESYYVKYKISIQMRNVTETEN